MKMTLNRILWLTLVAFAGTQAFAGEVVLNRFGKEVGLPHCNGTVKMTKSDQGSGDQANVIFEGLSQCTRFDIESVNGRDVNYDRKEIKADRNGRRSGSFTIPKKVYRDGFNSLRLRVAAKDGKPYDVVILKLDVDTGNDEPAPRGNSGAGYTNETTLDHWGDAIDLGRCGGTMKMTKSDSDGGEQVNLVISGVTACSVFDIKSNNGEGLDYDAKTIPDQGSTRGGSFTLPKRLTEYGWNNIKVIVRAKDGDPHRIVKLNFAVVPSVPMPVDVGRPLPPMNHNGGGY